MSEETKGVYKERGEGEKPFKRILKTVGAVLSYFLLFILVAFVFSGVISKIKGKDTVDFFGYSFYIVVSPSMATVHSENAEFLKGREDERILVGDMIVTKRLNEGETPKLYDVVTFVDREKKITVVHRVVKVEERENGAVFTTRGDGNNADDLGEKTASTFSGILVGNLGQIGKIALFVRNPYFFIGLGSCLFVVFGVWLIIEIRNQKEGKGEPS